MPLEIVGSFDCTLEGGFVAFFGKNRSPPSKGKEGGKKRVNIERRSRRSYSR